MPLPTPKICFASQGRVLLDGRPVGHVIRPCKNGPQSRRNWTLLLPGGVLEFASTRGGLASYILAAGVR